MTTPPLHRAPGISQNLIVVSGLYLIHIYQSLKNSFSLITKFDSGLWNLTLLGHIFLFVPINTMPVRVEQVATGIENREKRKKRGSAALK